MVNESEAVYATASNCCSFHQNIISAFVVAVFYDKLHPNAWFLLGIAFLDQIPVFPIALQIPHLRIYPTA
jgi:hypothetical protein